MPRNTPGYDDDFFAWTQEQARLLRAGELVLVDAANVAEEIDDMGRSIRRELRRRLTVLTMHLLKWQCQPGHRSRSWSGTIREQRGQVAELLQESPSLGPLLGEQLGKIYGAAVEKAVLDTGLPESSFPAECPFTPEQILASDFLPED